MEARYRYVVDRDKMRVGYPTVLSLKKSPLYLVSWLAAKLMGEPKSVRVDPEMMRKLLASEFTVA